MVISLLLLNAAFADTFTVGEGGEYGTIADAISFSFDGDTIEVDPGSYSEDLDFDGKQITVRSTSGLEDTEITGAIWLVSGETGDTVLEGFTITGEERSCIQIAGASPHLIDLFITGCGEEDSSMGGGITIESASPTLDNVYFENNVALWGAAIYASDSEDITLNNCTFSMNTAMHGGGIALFSSVLYAEDSVFSDNQALYGVGGGLWGIGSRVTLSGGRLEGNTASYAGGAIHLESSSLDMANLEAVERNSSSYSSGGALMIDNADDVSISNTTFSENSARDAGGAILVDSAAHLYLADLNFLENTSLSEDFGGGALFIHDVELVANVLQFDSNTTAGHGGGALILASQAAMNAIDLEGNSALRGGGGLAAIDGDLSITASTFTRNSGVEGGAGMWASTETLSVTSARFEFNESTGGAGGGLAISAFDATLIDLSVMGNTANVGGGLFADAEEYLHVQGSIFQENEALFTAGAIGVYGLGTFSAYNNDFLENSTLSASTTAQVSINGVETDFRNNIVAWGINGEGVTVDAEATASLVFMFNDVYDNESDDYGVTMGDRTGMDGNISVDPLFVDFSADLDFDNDDLHLNHGSPCEGTGDPALSPTDSGSSDIGTYPLTDIEIDDLDGDGFTADAGGDCNDSDPAINPDATELCDDLIDNNCDGIIDEDCEAGDTGTAGDTGSFTDTGWPDTGSDSVDTGAGGGDDDRTGEDTLVVPDSAEDIYKIEGEGCSCSSSSAPKGFAWFVLLPLVIRRRLRR
jgi:predicted outer membrane repeat protein